MATYSSRVRYETMATALNTRCSPATPFLNMSATKAIFAGAQSALVNSNFPAGEDFLIFALCINVWSHLFPSVDTRLLQPVFPAGANLVRS